MNRLKSDEKRAEELRYENYKKIVRNLRKGKVYESADKKNNNNIRKK